MMKDGSIVVLVGTECTPDVEEKWDKWYSEKHVPDALAFKGIANVARCKIVHPGRAYAGDDIEHGLDYPKHLAIYEFDNLPEVEAYLVTPGRTAAFADWNSWVRKGAKMKWRVHYEVVKTWQR